MTNKFWYKLFSAVNAVTLIFQLLAPLFLYAPAQVLAQSGTPTPTPTIVQETLTPTATPSVELTPTPTVTPVSTATPTDTPTITPTNTPTVTPTVTPDPSSTVTPTPNATITPDLSVTPTATPSETITPKPSVQPTGDTGITNNNQSQAPPTGTSTPTETVTTTPTVSPTVVPNNSSSNKHGNLNTVLLKNTAIDTLNLDPANTGTSAQISTNKADYAPTDTVIITGSNFDPKTSYTLEITSSDPPPVDFTTTIKTDPQGGFVYAYQLDGKYRPNYKVEVKDASGAVVAATTFTDTDPTTVTICHATDSNSNPYTTQSPNIQNNGSLSGGHLNHTGPLYPTDDWGDIIPPYNHGNFHYAGMNWTTQGQAIWNNGCSVKGTMIVKKVMVGGTDSFTFTGDVAGTISSNNESLTVNNVIPGTYSSVESAKSGWSLTSITCDDGQSANVSTGNTGTRTATFKVDAGETVTCTFTNTKQQGNIKIIKNTTGGDGTFGYTSTIPSNTNFSINTTSGTGSQTFSNVPTGQYTVTESALTGWSLTNRDCVGGNGPFGINPLGSSISITLGTNENVTCTFTNTKLPTLTVIKHVNNQFGGLLTASSFNLHVKSGGVDVTNSPVVGSETGTIYTLNTGTYSVSENTPPSGYVQVGFSGDCNSDGFITLAAGDNKTCTITNNDVQPKLTVTKIVSGGTAVVSDFNLFVGTTQVTSGVQNGFNAATYAITETGAQTSNYTASFSGDCNSQGSVTLGIGDVKSCTITNTRKQGRITFQKLVDDQSDVSDWTFTINGVDGTFYSGDSTTLNTGSYTVTESGSGDYTPFSVGGICTGLDGNEATLTVTQDGGTCTFTNHVKRGTVIVTKYQDNNADGSQNNGEPGLPEWDITLGETTQPTGDDGTTTFTDLMPGDYSLSEDLESHPDWIQSNISCFHGEEPVGYNENGYFVEVGAGQTIKCFVGNYQKGHIVVTKKIQNPDGKPQTNGDTTMFDFTVNGSEDNPSLGDGQSHTFDVTPGSHTVTETTNDNYDFLGCTNDGEPFETLQVTSGSTYLVSCVNKQKQGHVGGFKWNDQNGDGKYTCNNDERCEPKLEGWTIFVDLNGNGKWDEGEPKTTTDGSGNYTFNLNPGTYKICEVGQKGWLQTFPINGDTNNCHEVTLGSNQTFDGQKNFGNQQQTPILSLTKTNNTGGANKAPGDQVLFTLTVEATQSAANNVTVTDLPAGGFHYHPGSWTASSSVRGNLKGLGVTTEPTYHSPGVWQLGNMVPGEIVTLTYQIDIDSGQNPGLYPDLAWSQGTSLGSTQVLANATTGVFVGTQVNVVKDIQNYTSTNITQNVTQQGQVLGISTSLPATGVKIFWVWLTLAVLLLGAFVTSFGFLLRKGNNKFMGKISKNILTALVLGFLVLSVTPKVYAANVSISMEQPKTPTNQSGFDINFVALDTLGRTINVQCFKKGPSDGSFTQFGSTINLIPGGNNGNCSVNSSVVTGDGTYQFYVVAQAGGDSAQSLTDSISFNKTSPGTPTAYNKSKPTSCQYLITFTTANDGAQTDGGTVKVEVYRSDQTSFTVDPSTRVGVVSIGPNSNGNYTDNINPNCDKTYYYVIRAFDVYGNGSGTIGDSVTNVTITNATTTTTTQTGTAGTGGAIPVSGVNLGTGTSGSVLGTEKEATKPGEVLGNEATPSPEVVQVGTTKPQGLLTILKNNAILILILIVLTVITYALYRRSQAQ